MDGIQRIEEETSPVNIFKGLLEDIFSLFLSFVEVRKANFYN